MEYSKKNIKDPQFKSIKGVEVNSDSRKVSGVFSDFWSVDKAMDMIIPTAFDRSIKERGVESKAHDKILFHWMHDMTKPIGKITALSVDENSAKFEAVVSKIKQGDEALEQYADGTLNQHSFGYFYTKQCEWERLEDIIEEYPEMPEAKQQAAIEQVGLDGEVFLCKELKLIEISVVSYGCNADTPFTGFKSLTTPEISAKLNEALKDLAPQKQYQIKNIFTTISEREKDLAEKLAGLNSKQEDGVNDVFELFNNINIHKKTEK